MNNLIILKNIGLLPEFFLGISIIYLIIFGSILSTYKKYPLIQNLILNLSVLVLILCLFLTLNDKLWVQEMTLFNNSVVCDYLSYYSKILILVFSTLCLLMIQNYIKYQKLNQFEYSILILLSILGFLILCSANDLITAYLAIELQSLSFYVMASFKKNSSFSVEAGLKYFVLGSFSSAILLFGSSLLYGATGTLCFSDFKDLYFNTYPGVNNTASLSNYAESVMYHYSSTLLDSSVIKQLDYGKFKDIYSCFHPEYTNNNIIDELVEINDTRSTHVSGFNELEYTYFNSYDISSVLVNLESMKDFDIFNNNSIFKSTDGRIVHLFCSLFVLSDYLSKCTPKTEIHDTIQSIPQDSLLKQRFSDKILEFKQSMLENHNEIFGKPDIFSQSYLKICDNFLNTNFVFSPDFQDINVFQTNFNTELIQLGLILILVSLFFKLAVAPLHAWSPDVYEGSPTSSTLFFAVVSKLSIIVLLIRIFNHSFHGFIYQWRFYIVVLAVISIMIGSFGALEQKKLKSLLAYSSTSHIGYILIAFCTGTVEGIQSIMAYITIYMLAGSCLWSILIVLKVKSVDIYSKKTNKDLADLSSLIKSNRLIALIFSTVLFSIAGFPPLIGFFTKLNVFLSVVESSMFFVAFISILTSVISTFYYIRIVKILCFENKPVGRLYYPLPYLETLIIVTIFFLLIFLFINPTMLYLLSHKISLLLFF